MSTWAVLLAGLGQAASLAAPWGGQPQAWLQLLSLAVLVGQLHGVAGAAGARTARWGRAAGLAWVFATAWLAGTFWWLFVSMYTYGGMAAPLALLAVLSLAGALALFYVLACLVWVWLWSARVQAGWCAALVFALLWTLAELVRGRWLTGFPWGAIGYAHTDGLLAGYAPWLGVYGVGAVAAWVAGLLAWLWSQRSCVAPPSLLDVVRRGGAATRPGGRLAVAVLATLLVVPVLAQRLWPSFTLSTGVRSVALLQGNIPQDEKFQAHTGVVVALDWYGQQLQASSASLVVAPETAMPMLLRLLPDGYWQALQARFARGDQAALIGVPLGSFVEGYTNSVLGLQPGAAQPYAYHKHHLVPFGEFVPPMFKWFVRMMNIPLGDFNRGALVQDSLVWQGQRYAPNICYEDLFGEELAARFADAAQAPTVLVNVSNIAWFGGGAAIDQHLQISRMRALELERPMLRATNTGPTVIIDHHGQVTYSLPRLTRGVLQGQVEGRSGQTPYTRWVADWGLLPLWLLALFVPGLVLLMGRRGPV
jgi:apolipoprotein N-acyltransferase